MSRRDIPEGYVQIPKDTWDRVLEAALANSNLPSEDLELFKDEGWKAPEVKS
jgi:hypothetical protein